MKKSMKLGPEARKLIARRTAAGGLFPDYEETAPSLKIPADVRDMIPEGEEDKTFDVGGRPAGRPAGKRHEVGTRSKEDGCQTEKAGCR